MKILIAADGSEYGDAAIQAVAGFAGKAEVKIVSVYETPVMAVSAPYIMPTGYNPVLEKEFKDSANDAVVRAARKLREIAGQDADLSIETEILCGSPASLIVEAADAWGADLIVTGSHGYGFWKRMLLGSVSNAVVHHASCSVLIARKPTKIIE